MKTTLISLQKTFQKNMALKWLSNALIIFCFAILPVFSPSLLMAQNPEEAGSGLIADLNLSGGNGQIQIMSEGERAKFDGYLLDTRGLLSIIYQERLEKKYEIIGLENELKLQKELAKLEKQSYQDQIEFLKQSHKEEVQMKEDRIDNLTQQVKQNDKRAKINLYVGFSVGFVLAVGSTILAIKGIEAAANSN